MTGCPRSVADNPNQEHTTRFILVKLSGEVGGWEGCTGTHPWQCPALPEQFEGGAGRGHASFHRTLHQAGRCLTCWLRSRCCLFWSVEERGRASHMLVSFLAVLFWSVEERGRVPFLRTEALWWRGEEELTEPSSCRCSFRQASASYRYCRSSCTYTHRMSQGTEGSIRLSLSHMHAHTHTCTRTRTHTQQVTGC